MDGFSMNDVNRLAAELFLREFKNDQETSLSNDDILVRKNEASILLSCVPDLCDRLELLPEESTDEEIQRIFYDVGKENMGEENLRRFFALLYLLIWYKSSGPRFGVFGRMFGLENFIGLIRTRFDEALNTLA